MPAAPNTSASGGVLAPSTPQPAYGLDLLKIIQNLVAPITGLAGKMVRPAFQAEPATIPDEGDAWVALRITTQPADTFAAIIHKFDDESPEGFDQLVRNESINVLASFYDLGVGGQADGLMARLRDGLTIPQNCESIKRHSMALNSVGQPVVAPVIINTRWLYRVDLPFVLMRQVLRDYRVQSVLSATGEIVTDDGIVLEIDVAPAPAP